MPRKLQTLLLVLLLAAPAPGGPASGAGGEPANPLLQALRERGLAVPGLEPVKLPAPSMPDGLSPREQQAVIARVAGTTPLELFTRKSDSALFAHEIRSLEDGKGVRRGQAVDVHFVAQGKLATLTRGDALTALLGTDRDRASAKPAGGTVARTPPLSVDDLKARGIVLLAGKDGEEKFGPLDATLLDKVWLTGISRVVKTGGRSSVVLATELDGRFQDDPKTPNRWRALDRRPDATDAVGPPRPYAGFGGYVKATDLGDGMLFIELHTAFAEPPEWFDGRNLLRSKLPLALQENVRKFRRKLAAP